MSKNYLFPSEITNSSYLIEADLKKGQENYDDNHKRFGINGAIKIDGKPVFVKLLGTASTDGIQEGTWSLVINDTPRTGQYYSIGLELTNAEDELAFDLLTESLTNFIADDDWKVVNPSNNGKINIKLKYSGVKFDSRFNGAKLSINNVDDINKTVGYDTGMTVYAEIEPYFSFKDQKAGFNLIVRKIDFETELEITPSVFQQSKKQKK